MSVCVCPYKRQTQTQRERERERERERSLLKRRWNRRTAARWPRLELDVDDVSGYRG
jgi:hypothetical protein